MIRSTSAWCHAACARAMSVTTVTTGTPGAPRSRAATAAGPVSGWNDTIAAGPWPWAASMAGRSASASSVRRSSAMAGRELVA